MYNKASSQLNSAELKEKDKCYYNNKYKDSHIYLDMTIPNPSHTPIQANLSDVRSDPIVNNPSKYHLSIERFSIPGQLIPLQNLPNFGTGALNSITISYTGIYSQSFMGIPTQADYTGSTVQLSQPLGVELGDRHMSGAFINFYQTFADSTNLALLNSENTIKGSCPTYNADFTPFVSFNSSNDLFNLNVPRQYNEAIPGAPKIFMNNLLYNYYQSFQSTAYNIQNLPNPTGCDYQIRLKNNGGPISSSNAITLLSIPGSITGNYITGLSLQQEFPTLYNFNSFKRIVMTTSDFPVANTIVSNLNQGTIGDQSRQYFTTFQVSGDQGFDVRSNIQFTLVGPRRYIDLTGTDSLRKLGLKLFWEDNLQHLFPLYIPSHNAINILAQLSDKEHGY
jgi:hypothetical protein